MLFTFALAFILLSVSLCAREKGITEFSGLAVGFALLGCSSAAGSISGGVLNPALAVGVAFTRAEKMQLWSCLLFMLFQFSGGIIAAGVFFVTHPLLYEPAPEAAALGPGPGFQQGLAEE